MPAPSPDGCPEKATPATHRAMRALCCTAMLHLVHCLWRELAGQIRRLLHPPKRYSVPAMFTEGMSWAPHEVFRGRAGGHSLQPDDEKKVRPAGNYVEPQHKSTHQCSNTHQCPFPLKSLMKMFSGTHPGSTPRAQPHLLMKTEIKGNRTWLYSPTKPHL